MTKIFRLYFILSFLFVFHFELFGQLQISLPQLEGHEGQEEYTSIQVSDISGLNILAIQFNLYYDKKIISIEETDIGNILGLNNGLIINTVDTASGKIKFAWAGPSPVSGQGSLITFKIKYKSAGATNLTFNNINGLSTLIFNDGSVQYTVNGGMIKVKGVSVKIVDVIVDTTSPTELIVPVNVTDFDDIGAVSLKVTFDPSVISFTRVENINTNINLNITEHDGLVTIGWFDITGNSPVSLGDAKLLDLVFTYNAGTCSLMFVRPECEVMDSKGLQLNVKYYDGSIQQLVNVDNEKNIADKFYLEQNYPNPFNNQTKIKFTIPDDGSAVLHLYNAIGKEMFNTKIDAVRKGANEFIIDCSDYASGIYLIMLEYKGRSDNTSLITAARKLILLK